MSSPVRRGPALAGHNRISTQALTAVATLAAAEAFDVPASVVRAAWADDGGALALSLALPVRVPPLASVAARPELVAAAGGTVVQRSMAARSQILATVQELCGARVRSVDIRITGLHAGAEGTLA